MKNKLTLDLDHVKKFIESTGYKLLSTEYVNNHTKLNIMCDKGHPYYVKFNYFQQGRRCPVCKKIKNGNRCRESFNNVKLFIEKYGYKLLSNNYSNSHDKLTIMCPEDHLFDMRFYLFKQGQRCPICYREKIKSSIDTDEFKLYRLRVNNLTEKTYRKYKKIINPNSFIRGRNKYHLDHKFSVYDGFINNISPLLISSVDNLQMLSESDNISKHKRSTISIREILSFVDENVKTESVEIKDEMLDSE